MSQPATNKGNNRYGRVLAMDVISIGILITLALVLPHLSLFVWVLALLWAIVAVRRGINERRSRNERGHI